VSVGALLAVAASGVFEVARGLFALAVVFVVLATFTGALAVFVDGPEPQPIINVEKISIVVKDNSLDCIMTSKAENERLSDQVNTAFV
jgi:hypothetical protein